MLLCFGKHGRSAAQKNLKDPGFEAFFSQALIQSLFAKISFFFLQGGKITPNNFRWSASGGAFVKKKKIFTLTAVSTR